MTDRRRAKLALTMLLTLVGQQAAAAAQTEDLRRRTSDFVAMVDAESGKSALCRSYDGKQVVPIAFDALASRLIGPAAKGEYETTEQYRTRLSKGRTAINSAVLSVPIDRDYLRYDADAGAILVLAGIISTGNLGVSTQAKIAAEVTMMTATEALGTALRFSVEIPGNERAVSTGTARNAFGASVRTAEVDRVTRGLSLSETRLFAIARDELSPITGVEAPASKAAALKASLRAVMVIEPEAPYVVSGRMPGAAATNLNPYPLY